MIISRLVHVCRIILTTLYTLSFLISCIALPLLIGLIVQEFGYLDKVETRVITCTTRDKSDGEALFHGEAYARPSVSELEKIRLTCEADKEQRKAKDRYYDTFFLIDPYQDCNEVGEQHQASAQRHYDRLCIGKKDGTEVEKRTLIRSDFSHHELASILIINIPTMLVLYLMGYVFFGEKTIFPIRKFKKIQSP